jgi:GDPmannose 4,6-dehydratase
LFNHESERRGEEFVTRKITKAVARIKKSIESEEDFKPLELGNMNAKRDWSHAEDFVEAVWLMMNQENPKDYLLASGETHTVREFVDLAFKNANINNSSFQWVGSEESEILYCNGKAVVRVNPEFYRPAEVDLLLGDPSEAVNELGWIKRVDFETLVKRMVNNDLIID